MSEKPALDAPGSTASNEMARAPGGEPRHLLVIDDDDRLRDLLKEFLADRGFRVSAARDAAAARRLIETIRFDLLVVDVMMPGEDGLSLTRWLRGRAGAAGAAPVLILTARGDPEARIEGLRHGADDYLAKPFEPTELLARIEALIRRVRKERRIAVRTFHFDDVEIDFERSEILKAGQRVDVAAKELLLLRYLVDHRDRVVPREEILQKVWEYDSQVTSRTVDVHVSWLRQKLDNPQNPKHIQTVRGKGYRFTA
jgi:two-component system phosphate regulon response regulator OmpR